MSRVPTPEFVREVALVERQGQRRFSIEATPSERAALAKRLGLLELRALRANGVVRPGAGGHWTLEGSLAAAVVQACVVTLEPVAGTVEDAFTITFAPMGEDDAGEVDLTVADADPLPPGGKLDVGEIVAQHLSLALDPFPRAPGVGPGDRIESMGDGPATTTPFAGLAARISRKPPPGSGEA